MKVRGNLALVLQTSVLFGKVESKTATAEEACMVRVLSPISKLFTAKDCLNVVSEGIEGLGGIGYLEDSGLPSYLRNGQVLPIWEGTTNVLCWDVVRAIKHLGTQGLDNVLMWLRMSIDKAYRDDEPDLRTEKSYGDAYRYLIIVYTELSNILFDLVKGKNVELRYQFNLRQIVFAFSHVCIAVILLRMASDPEIIDEHSRYSEREAHVTAFIEWVRREDFPSIELFARVKEFSDEKAETTKNLALVGLDGELITNLMRPKF